ncbi:hypothetical protein Droror1_Dr00015735 [Drosera rotundifolia]
MYAQVGTKMFYRCLERNGSFASAKRFSASATAVCIQKDIFPATNKEIDFDVKLNSCSDVRTLKKLHTLLVVSGKAQTIFISTKLVNLFALLGDVSSACDIFCQMSSKDAYTWNSMIAAYVRLGRFRDAMSCFKEMIFMVKFLQIGILSLLCSRLVGIWLTGKYFTLGFSSWVLFGMFSLLLRWFTCIADLGLL